MNSLILVACPVPVDITLIHDDILFPFHQTQIMRLHAGEVVHSHDHLLFLSLLIVFLIIFGGWGGRRRIPTLRRSRSDYRLAAPGLY